MGFTTRRRSDLAVLRLAATPSTADTHHNRYSHFTHFIHTHTHTHACMYSHYTMRRFSYFVRSNREIGFLSFRLYRTTVVATTDETIRPYATVAHAARFLSDNVNVSIIYDISATKRPSGNPIGT